MGRLTTNISAAADEAERLAPELERVARAVRGSGGGGGDGGGLIPAGDGAVLATRGSGGGGGGGGGRVVFRGASPPINALPSEIPRLLGLAGRLSGQIAELRNLLAAPGGGTMTRLRGGL